MLTTRVKHLYQFKNIRSNRFLYKFNSAFKKQRNNDDFFYKSITSLLSTLEYAKLKKKSEDHFYIFALRNYLIHYPTSERSQTFYQKLFSKYFELKEIKKSINVLLVYRKNYPKDEKFIKKCLLR